MVQEKWKTVALLTGTQIGAGVLGLPYAIKGLGFFWGTTAILLASLLTYITALFLVDALYRTNPNYHLFELVEHHYGPIGSYLFTLFILISAYGAMTAYLVGMGESIQYFIHVSAVIDAVVLWALLSYTIYAGIRLSSDVESAGTFLLVLLFLITILWAIPFIKPYHVPISAQNLSLFFTAVSVSIFAFFIHLIIPEAVRSLRNKKEVAEALGITFLISTTIYILYSLAVIGVLGDKTPEISIFGLVPIFGSIFGPIAYLRPLLTMLTSFLGVGLGSMDMLSEFIRKKYISASIVLVPPLLMYLLHVSFFQSLVFGAVGLILAGGIVPSLLVLTMKRRRVVSYRVWLAGLTLFIFTLILIWELFEYL